MLAWKTRTVRESVFHETVSCKTYRAHVPSSIDQIVANPFDDWQVVVLPSQCWCPRSGVFPLTVERTHCVNIWTRRQTKALYQHCGRTAFLLGTGRGVWSRSRRQKRRQCDSIKPLGLPITKARPKITRRKSNDDSCMSAEILHSHLENLTAKILPCHKHPRNGTTRTGATAREGLYRRVCLQNAWFQDNWLGATAWSRNDSKLPERC